MEVKARMRLGKDGGVKRSASNITFKFLEDPERGF